MNRIVVTGATGYIGSNLVKHFVDEGFDVHIIIRPTSNTNLILNLKDRLNIHTFRGETSEIVKIFDNVKPNAVFHLAALFISEHKPEDIAPLIESNILFGTQLLEAAARSGVKYFINTGTHWQNYNGESYNPVNLYAASKQAFECMAKYYLEASQMRMLTVKLIDTYGPFDPRPKVMSLFKRIARTGEELDMSPGEQELGLLYIDDVVKGFMLALEYIQKMQPHEQYSCVLAPKEFHKLREVAQIFQKVSGLPLNINWGKRSYRQREVMEVLINEFNILDEYKAINLQDGIKKMVEKEGYV